MNEPLTILYFAWLRERIGLAQEKLPLPDGVKTISELLDYLSVRNTNYAAAFGNRKSIRCAVNQEFVDSSLPVRPGDEVAFFPPVTGG
jgi:molybdopterin converting factor subunit 1